MSGYDLVIQKDTISIEPSLMSNAYVIKDSLIAKIEGFVVPEGFYVLKVIHICDDYLGKGQISDIDGSINYNVRYSALVFNPVEGSVFDIIVNKVTDVGIWGEPLLCKKYSLNILKIECKTEGNKKGIEVGLIIKFRVLMKQIEYTKISILGTIVK